MSQENVELVRGWSSAFVATGEADLSVLHPDFELHDHDVPDSQLHRGPSGFERWMAEWGDAWSEYAVQAEEYIDAGDRVVGVHRFTATGKGSGVTLDRQDAVVYAFRDGLILRIDYFNSKAEALEAVGLAE